MGPRICPPSLPFPAATSGPVSLGVQYAPFNTAATPQPGRPFSVRGISLGSGLTVTDVEKRQNLLENLDQAFAGLESQNELLEGLDRFSQQAHEIITSKRAPRGL